uniref:Tumor suppressor 2, mitochondrial calcium regulator like 1 n=1 Tax=Rattus norvegicus TaxID=10116 RepID=A0ABK0M0E7_RAT
MFTDEEWKRKDALIVSTFIQLIREEPTYEPRLAIFCFGVGSPVAEVAKQSLVRSRARAVPPFVFTRRGSMFYDEDGDLAHEFYEETIITKNGQKRSNLRDLKFLSYRLCICFDSTTPRTLSSINLEWSYYPGTHPGL